MPFIVSLFLAFVPALIYAGIIYWMDRYEKEPLHLLLGVFSWGAIVAAGGAFILNTIFGIAVYSLTADPTVTDIATGSVSAPLVEESLKGFAVLLVFLIFRKEFDSILDGIVYAGITALGFAASENVLYMLQYGYADGGWSELFFIFFLRVILGAWNHATYTAFIGIGLAIARNNRNAFIKIIAPLSGFGLAVFTHFFHNTLAVFAGEGGIILLFLVDWLGWLFMLGIMFWAITREKRWIQTHLQPEVDANVISPAQYKTALSPFKRGLARLSTLGSSSNRTTRQFYQKCAELAYKKHQIAAVGESGGNTHEMIEKLRTEINHLAGKASS